MDRNNVKITDKTRWIDQRVSINQPTGIDYEQLSKKIDNKKDLRKKSYKIEDLNLNENQSLKDIDKKSIIPIPGMLIDIENSNSDTRPPDSDWIAPHGPQWGPMTL
jgi:hypothetical protein